MTVMRANICSDAFYNLPLHYFDQRHVDTIDQVEWIQRQVTHPPPPMWDILLPLA